MCQDRKSPLLLFRGDLIPYKPFDPDLIKASKNPFGDRSCALCEGVFTKDGTGDTFTNTDKLPIELGILKELRRCLKNIESGDRSSHILILADYGHGKTFALKVLEEDILRRYYGSVIAFSLSNELKYLTSDNSSDAEHFWRKTIENLRRIFRSLSESEFPSKNSVADKYRLHVEKKGFSQSLQAYDAAFQDVKLRVYIILDELDKILVSSVEDDRKKAFLEELRAITDCCKKSVALFIAGTSECKRVMDAFGFDYGDRFGLIDSTSFNEDQTYDFIRAKSLTVVKYVGEIPFTKGCIRSIHNMSRGKLRYIEAISADMWISVSQKKKRMDEETFRTETRPHLVEPIKRVLGTDLRTYVIQFISLLIMAEEKQSIAKSLKSFRPRQISNIKQYVEQHPEIVKTIGESYRIEPKIQQKIINVYLGVAGSYGNPKESS